MNLFDILKENISEDVVKQTAKTLDESPENTRTAFEAMMHTLVGGLMKRTSSTMGLNQLFSQVQKSGFDMAWLERLPSILAKSDEQAQLITKGGGLTSQLFPAMKSQISGMVLGLSGLRSSSASALISIATPMVIAALNKIVIEKQMNADALAEFLIEQRDNLLKDTNPELMEKMVNVLALQDIISGKNAPTKVGNSTVINKKVSVSSTRMPLNPPVFESKPVTKFDIDKDEDSESNNKASIKWFLIALSVIAVITASIFAWQYFNNNQEVEVAEETPEPITLAVDSTKIDSTTRDSVLTKIDTTKVIQPATVIDSSKLVVPALAPAKLPAGVKSAFAQQLLAGKVGDAIVATGIDYEANSIIQPTSSNTAINDLVKLLNANPTMQIKLINLSNDAVTPQSNKALSISRAYDLKKKLMVAGIDANRVDAVGIGSGVNNANQKQMIVKLVSK